MGRPVGSVVDKKPGPRAIEVIRHLAEGKTQKETAYLMGISYATVGAHLDKLYSVLNAHNPTHAFRLLVEKGYIPSSMRSALCPIDLMLATTP